MTHEIEQKNIHDRILESIKKDRVQMRPKWHFILRTLLFGIGVVILFLGSLYLVSFVIFMLRDSGAWFVSAFGGHGWYVLLRSMPWFLMSLVLLFILILEILVRRYAFAYRSPFLFSAFAILVLVGAGGYVVSTTSLHGELDTYAQEGRLPVAGPLYRVFGHPHLKDVHKGIVRELRQNGFVMQNRRAEMLIIFVAPHTRLPMGMPLDTGEMVVVFGDRDGSIVQAIGVRRLPMK